MSRADRRSCRGRTRSGCGSATRASRASVPSGSSARRSATAPQHARDRERERVVVSRVEQQAVEELQALTRSPGRRPSVIGGTPPHRFVDLDDQFGPSRSIATSAVRIFVVEAMCRRRWMYRPHSTFPVSASTRIAARALSLIPCAGGAPSSGGAGTGRGGARDERGADECEEYEASQAGCPG